MDDSHGRNYADDFRERKIPARTGGFDPCCIGNFQPLQTANGIPEALSNLWFRQEISIAEIEDAVLDAKNGKELANSLNRIKLFRKFTLDRELDGMVRLKGTDVWKNISYLKVYTATPPKKPTPKVPVERLEPFLLS